MSSTITTLSTAIADHADLEWEPVSDLGGDAAAVYLAGADYGILAGPREDGDGEVAITYTVAHALDGVAASEAYTDPMDAVMEAECLQEAG